MQGDSYSIKIKISQDGLPLTPEMVEEVEIAIGSYIKKYPGEVSYLDESWLFPVSQKESFAMMAVPQPCQLRVKLAGGDVFGTDMGSIDVCDSLSKEVL